MNDVNKILEQFEGFTDGIRLLMLTHRNKEGGHDRSSIKRISKNSEDFKCCLLELLDIKNKSKIPYRIYSSVNSRNIDKSIRTFKQNQLDADYFDIDSRNSFYFDIKNRWISALMKPSSRTETNFIIDIDEDDELTLNDAKNTLREITRNYKVFETKTGHNIVSEPFNPQLMEGYKINKDGLILLSY